MYKVTPLRRINLSNKYKVLAIATRRAGRVQNKNGKNSFKHLIEFGGKNHV